jgi:hypothetical protein
MISDRQRVLPKLTDVMRELDRFENTWREVNAMAKRMGLDIQCMTNKQVVEAIWQVVGKR